MSSRKLIVSGSILLLGGSALACGPFFPNALMDNREQTFKAAPTNGFLFEATHLIAIPDDGLKPAETEYRSWESDEDNAKAVLKQRTDAEAVGLTGDQAALVAKMRAAETGDAAFAVGAGLPDAVRLYTAAAVDYAHKRWPEAEARLKAVLDLPGDAGQPRRTWAAYTLARLQTQQDDAAAAGSFAEVRKLALAGAPDPLGLAVASYGEEAKTHLDRAEALVPGGGKPVLSPDGVAAYRTEIAAAVSLYAVQAAHKSSEGAQSLRVVADTVLATPAQTAAVIDDPLTRQLLVAYVAAGGDNRLGAVVAALEAKAVMDVPGADRLAAASYQAGRYDFAAKLADRAHSPLASWVKAKLALQKGDLNAADGFYADAVKAFPADTSLSPSNAQLVVGEHAVLILSRGDYVAALEQLYPVGATYWSDVAYLADRVLTVDELKSFVDTRLPALKAMPETQSPTEEGTWDVDPAAQLRNLLGRRLVRAGRYAEAVGYFSQVPRRDRTGPTRDVRGSVTDYAAVLQRASTAWWGIDRAEAWYRAAHIARTAGMEMMGYEGPPDQAYSEGELDGGIGPEKLEGEFIGAGEQQRYAASAAAPDRRFHYRFIAVDEAMQAADLLPPRSQAFAAVLCQATGWMLDSYGDPDRVAALYRRYVKEGAHVPWAAKFGVECPEPDFAEARHLKWIEPVWTVRHFLGRHRWPIGAALVILFGGAGAWWLRRRRHAA